MIRKLECFGRVFVEVTLLNRFFVVVFLELDLIRNKLMHRPNNDVDVLMNRHMLNIHTFAHKLAKEMILTLPNAMFTPKI